jgi:outer membrane protein TolC
MSNLICAEEITLKKALKHGLNQNSDIKALQREIKNIEKDLLSIKARQDWQVNIGGAYNYSPNSLNTGNGVNLNVNKTFSSGLTIQPEIIISEINFDSEFRVNVSHSFLPSTPTRLQKQYWRTEKNLTKTKENLVQQKINKIISWLETYLSLTRLKERKEIYQQAVQKAESNLKEIREKQNIGEAGKKELLTAEISLENARYNKIEIEKRIEETEMSFYQNLGLEGDGVIINRKTNFLRNLTNQLDEIVSNYVETKNQELMTIIENKHYNLMINRINREILKKEKEWLQKEGRTEAGISGNYDSENNDFTIGINVFYSLYDSGERTINLEKKDIVLKNNLEQYHDLCQQLEIRLKQNLNNLELNQLELNKNKKMLKKSKNELEVAKKQLDMGLIDYLDYQEYYLSKRDNEVSIKSIKDQLFINKLELIKLINSEQLQEVLLK